MRCRTLVRIVALGIGVGCSGGNSGTYSGTYSGTIVAEAAVTPTMGLLLDVFEAGPLPTWSDLLGTSDLFGWDCASASMTVGSCCETRIFPPNFPVPEAPSKAGAVTIELGGKLLATLDPLILGMGTEYGHFAQDAPVSFGTGHALTVAGSGSGMVAPFTGTLEVPISLTGMDPVLGTRPITVDRSKAFQFSWTPEGKDGEVMEFWFTDPSYAISCHVPDSAGSVVVDASLLSALPAGMAQVFALRVIPRTASGANAKVALIGEAVTSGEATLK